MAALEAAMAPVFREHGASPVEISFKTDAGGWVLRVLVEPPWDGVTPEPGISPSLSLDQIADLSRALSAVLDVVDLIPHRYSLEVGSPGLDRPLGSHGDFRRFAGRSAKVQLSRAVANGQKVLRGALLGADQKVFRMNVDGHPVEAPLADVVRANLVFELPSTPKGRRPTHAKQSKNQKR